MALEFHEKINEDIKEKIQNLALVFELAFKNIKSVFQKVRQVMRTFSDKFKKVNYELSIEKAKEIGLDRNKINNINFYFDYIYYTNEIKRLKRIMRRTKKFRTKKKISKRIDNLKIKALLKGVYLYEELKQ